MNIKRAFFAGVNAAFIVTVLMAVGRAAGLDANFEMLLGTFFGGRPGAGTWFLGFLEHLVAGGLLGIGYIFVMRRLLHRVDWRVGAGIGVLHAVVAGFLLSQILRLHPLVPNELAQPGMYLSNIGTIGVIAFFLVHAIFGGFIGGMYGEVEQVRTTAQPTLTGTRTSFSTPTKKSGDDVHPPV